MSVAMGERSRHAGRRAASERRSTDRARDELVVCRSERDLAGLCREARRGGITRRQFIERALVLGLSATAVGALASACGGEGPSPSPTGTLPPMDEAKPADIVFYNWTDYFDPAIGRQFERETGIAVKERYFASGEEMVWRFTPERSKGVDVMAPSDYMVAIMTGGGWPGSDEVKWSMLQPLDIAYLPNFQYVAEPFRAPVYDDPARQDGLRYSVPYFYGTTGYCQRLDKVREPQTSWDALWDKRHKGAINLLDDERECIGMALNRRGYSLNTTDQAELDQATSDLIEQKPLVATYDSVNMTRNIVQGQSFVMSWDGDVLLALDRLGDDEVAKRQIHWVLPDEGYARWCDALVIPVSSPYRYAAHLFIDFLMRPDIAGQNASWVKYLSPIAPASWEFTDPFALTLKPTDEELARGEAFTDVGEFATAYSDAWRKMKSA